MGLPRWTWIIAVLALAGCGSDLPPPAPSETANAAQQAATFIEAIKPRREGKPVIAIVARNEGTEITDFLLTHAVLQRADIAEVHAVRTSRRSRLFISSVAGRSRHRISPASTRPIPNWRRLRDRAGDERTGDGRYRRRLILAWLKQQSDHGARIIGVCAGGLVVGNAGLARSISASRRTGTTSMNCARVIRRRSMFLISVT